VNSLVFCCCAIVSHSQQPTLYFQKLTTENGLSHNKINCILQDKRGFVWIGTDDGLNRYDGNKFIIFRNRPSDSSSLTGNIIADILEDHDGVLWIATLDGGLARYDYRLAPRLQFKQFRHSDIDSLSIPVNIINALLEDSRGHLWLASSGFGLLRFDKKRQRFDQLIKDRARTVLDLAMDSKGMIWAGRQGGGLLKVDPETLSAERDERYNDVYMKLPHMTVTSLFKDSRNDMWLGSWDKVVYRYENGSGAAIKKVLLELDDGQAFAEDSKNRIWIGGKFNGLYIFEPALQKYYHFNHDPSKEGTLADNQVNCIYIDRAGIVWVGTNRGISMHDPAQQQFSQSFLPNEDPKHKIVIYDFYRTAEGNLMIGTTDGIYLQKPDGSFSHLPLKFGETPLAVTRFYKANSGQLYLGTNLSLFRFDEKNHSLSRLPNTDKDVVMNRIIESRVVSIEESKVGEHPVLLVSPYGHFFTYYDFVLNKWISRQDSVVKPIQTFQIKDHLIRKFYRSKSGCIWIANTRMGLGQWENGAPIRYYSNMPNKKGTITNNHVYDIREDGLGNLWISTYGGGLHHFNPRSKQFEQITASYNLTEGIQVDRKGIVWMIANGALHKYDWRTQSFSSFLLPDLEKTGGPSGYIFKDESGVLYLAGLNYFIRFNPDSIRELSHQPKVYLTDFKIFNDSYSDRLSEKEILLRYDKNYFSFEFAAPNFHAGHPVQYAYMLEGVDPAWMESGLQNIANYTNLSGGKYVFKVRATTKPGVWSNEIASIQIRILPPFWNTWWFYAIVALVSTGAIYAMYRYRINELLKRQAIRDKIAQDIHDNVGSTLSSISVYSQVAKIQSSKGNSNALEDILAKIAAASSEMISDMNDIVWTINPRNDSMEKIIQRMESYAKPLLNAANIQFTLEYDPSVLHINLDMTSRKNFYLIFKEAIHNGLKYAECKKIDVSIRRTNHHVELMVRDDGIGFNQAIVEAKAAQSLSGNGLRNLRIRTGEMKGECIIESSPGNGTKVYLKFPLP
jgi:ligand-binding sensor domain-containing protein/two-component sensor histidine kinase